MCYTLRLPSLSLSLGCSDVAVFCVSVAHREVCNVLLQVFDEGHLTDGQGRRVDFRNTICICTSNLGSALLQPLHTSQTLSVDVAEVEVQRLERLMKEAARSHFPPEFINRLDDLVTFRPLTADVMPAIVDIQLRAVSRLLQEQAVELSVDDDAKRWLGAQGFEPELGARPLKRVIYQQLLTPLAKKILAGELHAQGKVLVSVDSATHALRIENQRPRDANTPPVHPIRMEPLLEPEEDAEVVHSGTERALSQSREEQPQQPRGTQQPPLSDGRRSSSSYSSIV